MNNLYVQYGCGWSAPTNWKNFDASPTLRFERIPIIGKLYIKNASRFPKNVAYGDIINGLPISEDSCKGVYNSHILEHLSLEDFRLALKNTYKILQPGGVFRFVLPDLEHFIHEYTINSSADAAVIFLRETYLGREKRSRGIKAFIVDWMGNSQHLWMWDYKSIEHELKDIGFTHIRRAIFNDSSDPIFKEAENEERWKFCLGVECKKT